MPAAHTRTGPEIPGLFRLGPGMHLTRLRVSDLRCLRDVELTPGPGLNLVLGENGAGKTSLIEAIHLLGYGRSFRGRVRDGVVRLGAPALELFAEWQGRDGGTRRAGLRHSGAHWEARLDGQPAASLSELCAELAVITFEPGSHELVVGPAEHRRRYLDWGLFHVEPTFLPLWRRYSRGLRQRNTLLKSGPTADALEPWDREIADSGEALHQLRQGYLERLEPRLLEAAGRFLPELAGAGVRLQPGWRRGEVSLLDALLMARARDLAAGFTSVGPHRADWRLEYHAHPGRDALSRGQAKLTALACILAQAEDYAAIQGEWPVVCLDDLGSELDRRHQGLVLESLLTSGAQVWLSGTEAPWLPDAGTQDNVVFHVERGALRRD